MSIERTLCRTVYRVLYLLTLTTLSVAPAHAFDQLTEAQTLIYDTPHLVGTTAGQTINYTYSSDVADAEKISDAVKLTVTREYDDERRDLSLTFLNGERNLAFPDFTAFRGNPVIIAMLEHIAQDLAERTGGGTLYFRNRIRDGLAGDVKVTTEANTDSENTSTTVSFKPFVDDPHIGGDAQYANAEFSIELSEKVPGTVIAVEVRSASATEFFYHQKIAVQ